jgi:hypothetical protein
VKTFTLILLFVILALVGAATATVRGTYQIIKGEEDSVCQKFLANLKALGEPALVCGAYYTAYCSGDVPLGEKGWLFLRGELDFCEFEFNADKQEKTK